MAMQPNPGDSVEFSAAATLIPFPRPLPLLRESIPAGLSDDPTAGPFVLAFRDSHSWSAAFKACESQIITQCEAGVRIGCSITASSKCSPPWWKNVLGFSKTDFEEREKCEEREMEICIRSSVDNCRKIAKEKCLPAFRDARIAMNNPELNKRYVSNLITESEPRFELTNFRGSDLMN